MVSLRAVEDGDLPLFFEWQADDESSRVADQEQRRYPCGRSSRTVPWPGMP
jgi:hypothetical protein